MAATACASRLVTWLAWLAWLAVAAAHAKHLGGRLAMETPPTAITTGETATSTERRNSSSLSGLPELGASLRSPLAVYTVPLGARVALTPLGVRSPGRANQSTALPDLFHIRMDLKQLDYIKYSDSPAMELKYFLVKATWTEAQAACAGDGAALYTFDHSAQLDAAMANFYPLLEPWLDLQKPGVDGGSLVCGFLNGPASGNSSLQWDDCHALHHFVCQKPASTSTKFHAQNIRGPPMLAPRKTLVTLLDYLTAFLAQSQTAVSLFKPMINSAAVQSSLLTSLQASEIDSLMTQWQDFNFVEMPVIITMITTTPTMTVAQIQQIQLATAKGVLLFAEAKTLFSRYLAELNLNGTQFPVLDFAGQAVSFYTAISGVVSNTLTQSTISPTQATTLQDIIKLTQTLIDDAEIAFRAMSTKAVPTLAQLLQSVQTPYHATISLLLPVITAAAANSLTITPTEVEELQFDLFFIQDFVDVSMPAIIPIVEANPTLSPTELQQLDFLLSTGVYLSTALQNIVTTIGPKLNLDTALQQAIGEIPIQGIPLFNALLAVVNDPSGQPLISAAQMTQIQNLIAQTQSAADTIASLLRAKTVTQVLQATLAPGKAVFCLLAPIISAAAASSQTLTPTEEAAIQATFALGKNFEFVLMPNVISMVEGNPTLSPTQLQQLANAITQGVTFTITLQNLVAAFGSKLNLNPTVEQTLIDIAGQGTQVFGALLVAVNDPSGQPTISTAQLAQIQHIVAQSQSVLDSVSSFLATTAVAPGPNLALLLQAAMAPYQTTFSLLQPIISAAAANSQKLTPMETAELQAALSQVQNFNAVLMPGIIAMLEANPTLSTTQLQQLADAVTLGVTLSTTVQNIAATIGPKLHLDPEILQAITDIGTQGIPLFGALLTAVNDQCGQPTVSAAQLTQIQEMIAQAQSVASAAASAVASTPTHGGHHHQQGSGHHHNQGPGHQQHHGSSYTSSRLILARIRGLLAELEELLPLLRSTSSTSGIRTTAAQRRQPEAMVTQLLTLRTRQAETEARVRSMTAHEQQAIAGKLEAAQRKLRKVVTDRSQLAQHLTVTSGKQQPIVELLNETVDALQPFL